VEGSSTHITSGTAIITVLSSTGGGNGGDGGGGNGGDGGNGGGDGSMHVIIAPSAANIKVGEQRQLSATIDNYDGWDMDWTWTSSDNSVVSISGNSGTVQIEGLKSGNAVVTAQASLESAGQPIQSGTCTVSVKEAADGVGNVLIDTTFTSVAVGIGWELNAQVVNTDSLGIVKDNIKWEWESSDPSVAINPVVVTPAKDRCVAATKGLQVGKSAIMTAMAVIDGKIVAEGSITLSFVTNKSDMSDSLWKPDPSTTPSAVKERIQKYLTKKDFEDLFPNRYGFGLWESYPNPNNFEQPRFDYYSYDNLLAAGEKLANVVYIIEAREEQEIWNQQHFLFHKDDPEKKLVKIREDQYFNLNEPWVQDHPIMREVIDFGNFLNHRVDNDNKREMAAILANLTQETSGGTSSHMPTRLDMALYFNEETGHIGQPEHLGYFTAHAAYPPTPGKSYHGRGPFQLSWNYNYGLFSHLFYNDAALFLDHPEMLVEDGVLGWLSAIFFWMTPQNPKASMWQVMDTDYQLVPKYADKFIKGFGLTIVIINGGFEADQEEGYLVQGQLGMEMAPGTNGQVWTRVNMYRRVAERLGANIEGEKIDTKGMKAWDS
jgi:uncharacterized protein YjdB